MATTITNNGASIKVDNGTTIRNLMKNQIKEVSVTKNNKIKIDMGKDALDAVFIDYGDVSSPTAINAGDLRDQINDMMANSVGSGSTSGGATEAKQDTQITKLSSIDSTTSAISSKVNSIDSSTTNISTKVNSIDASSTAISSKVNSIDTSAAAISTKVTSIDSNTSSISTKVNSIDTNTSSINGKVTSIDSSTSAIRTKVGSIDDKIFYSPILVDETNPNVVYEGYADPGTLTSANTWAIRRISNNDGMKYYQWANGNRNFNNSFDNRESLTYI